MANCYQHDFYLDNTEVTLETSNDPQGVNLKIRDSKGLIQRYYYFDSETIRNQFLYSLRHQIDQIFGGKK